MKVVLKQKIILLVFFALSMPLLSVKANAYTYGSGLYGACVYGGELGDAALSFNVNTTSISFNNANTSTTKTATVAFSTTISCSNYGYAVTISGNPPTAGGYTLANLTSPTASSAGTEQFGANLVANSSPSVGANPSGGTGSAASGYNTANQFKYISGNTIASTAGNSSQTDYTISFIVNVSPTTPARNYSGTLMLICTATY